MVEVNFRQLMDEISTLDKQRQIGGEEHRPGTEAKRS